ncbi:MAG: hypothetical protein DYG89_44710 [Caldilinea sp. CFX5]|nr:hypothetical protein [Caldilinea sp. CFX5]
MEARRPPYQTFCHLQFAYSSLLVIDTQRKMTGAEKLKGMSKFFEPGSFAGAPNIIDLHINVAIRFHAGRAMRLHDSKKFSETWVFATPQDINAPVRIKLRL